LDESSGCWIVEDFVQWLHEESVDIKVEDAIVFQHLQDTQLGELVPISRGPPQSLANPPRESNIFNVCHYYAIKNELLSLVLRDGGCNHYNEWDGVARLRFGVREELVG
jgi:hypothetical protein